MSFMPMLSFDAHAIKDNSLYNTFKMTPKDENFNELEKNIL